jgi:outer membrane lipoprotein-sorting protein
MKNFTTFILTLIIGFCHAQNRDPDAQTLLNEMSAKVNEYDNMVLEFKYALDNSEENIHQDTRGVITLVGDNYVLNILGIIRIFDGEKLITISPEDEEVTISKQNTAEENTITPSQLLTFYEEGYNYKMDIIQNVRGRKIQYIKLNPIDSNSEISYVLLGIDTNTKHVYNLIEIGSNGTKTTLTINAFKTNQPLSETLFTFDASKYSDYYINNLD